MKFVPRPYQVDAVAANMADLAAGVKKIANILPTGAGKTEVMAMTANAWIQANPGRSILNLSHLSLLTDQSFRRFKLRAPSLSVGIHQRQKKAVMTNDVVISTMQTARSKKHIEHIKQELIKPVGLIMVDETHMLPTQSYETIQAYFPNLPLIGFTATPFREKRLMTNYFDKISFTISLQELIDQGYLVPPVVHEIAVTHADDERAEIMNIVSLYLREQRGLPAIAYMKTIEEAKMLRNVFEEHGVKARAVTSEVTGPERQLIFDSFNDGSTTVLTTVDVLTAGFDAPHVRSIFMPYGTKSPTQYLQRIGRGLRPCEGKTSCDVYILGDAPQVGKKLYDKINKVILLAGSSSKTKTTYKEDAELNFFARNSEIYEWTQEVNRVIKKMESLGMDNFAELLDRKQFPEEYMTSIKELIKRLPKNAKKMKDGDKPASDGQKSVLFEAHFTSDFVDKLTKREASMMITAIMNKEHKASHGSLEKFKLTEGLHKGKYVFQTPHAYRQKVKKGKPDSPAALLIKEWESHRKQRA